MEEELKYYIAADGSKVPLRFITTDSLKIIGNDPHNQREKYLLLDIKEELTLRGEQLHIITKVS